MFRSRVQIRPFFNPTLVAPSDAPKKWTDLCDPKWMEQVALAHPGFSGAAGAWVVAMNNLYGWEFFEKLKANKPFVSRSLLDPRFKSRPAKERLASPLLDRPLRWKRRARTLFRLSERRADRRRCDDRFGRQLKISQCGKIVRRVSAKQDLWRYFCWRVHVARTNDCRTLMSHFFKCLILLKRFSRWQE